MMLKRLWKALKQSFLDIFNKRILKLSAALAYYTLFSLPGLLIVIIWVSDIFYGHQIVEGAVYGQIATLIGPDAATQVQQTMSNAIVLSQSKIATIIGVTTLVFGASGIFGEIQDSINLIWNLKSKPKKGRGWLKLIVNRLLSFSMVISLGFLLLVSLLINSLMDIFISKLTSVFPQTEVFVAYAVNLVLNFLITSFLFALIFKVLPDAKIKWKHVRAGAFATAALFMVGKFLIGLYLGQNRMTSIYGAAGSVILILLWVYYSAVILYFGAAYTRAYAIESGSNIYPNSYAVWTEEVEVQSQKSLQNHDATKKVVEGAQQTNRE
ncbi:MAG: YihY/virulence factor BrkB family protein [Chitinophagaceae bacterium]